MNATELKVQMVRKGKSAKDLYTALGISSSAWFRKVKGEDVFTQVEIKGLRHELELDDRMTGIIFFPDDVS